MKLGLADETAGEQERIVPIYSMNMRYINHMVEVVISSL